LPALVKSVEASWGGGGAPTLSHTDRGGNRGPGSTGGDVNKKRSLTGSFLKGLRARDSPEHLSGVIPSKAEKKSRKFYVGKDFTGGLFVLRALNYDL